MFASVAAVAVLSEDWRWHTYLLLVLVPLSIAGFADAITSRVDLREDVLVINENFRTRSYPRGLFTKVSAEKGVPIALHTVDGMWVKLPRVSPGGQGLVNKLRAWVKYKSG